MEESEEVEERGDGRKGLQSKGTMGGGEGGTGDRFFNALKV